MRNTLAIVVVGLVAAAAAAAALGQDGLAAPSDQEIATPRGVNLKANVHLPAKGNGAAVVLAPGQGYHKELPLMRRGAEALAAAGFTAVRFDWAYFTANGEPSPDHSTEVADLDAAVRHARKLPGVESVLVAGKSLGSMVVTRWGQAHRADAAGFALLTPPFGDPEDPTKVREGMNGFEKLGDTAFLAVGDKDPLCDLQLLYRTLASTGSRQRVVIVPGDHSFLQGEKTSPESAENIDLVIRNLVVWAKRRITQ